MAEYKLPYSASEIEAKLGQIGNKAEKATTLEGYGITDGAKKSDVPTKTSQLTNDSNFITNAVEDLVNYYKKSETYTQEEINQKLSAIPKFSIQVVDSLPTADISTTTVYLVKSGEESQNLYTEYIYVNGQWEYLGKQTVDLTGYALKTDIPTTLPASDVYSWAKQPAKPTYTADEVGAVSKEIFEEVESDHESRISLVEQQSETNKKDIAAESTARENAIDELKAQGVQQTPLFANDTSECTDTSKVYVLPDGYIYGYIKKSAPVEHNANDGTGFLNVRPTASSGTSKEDNVTKNGLFTTAPIAIDNSWPDCIVNISGLEKLVPTFYASLYVYYFDSTGTYIAYNANNAIFKPDGSRLSESAEVELPLPISINIGLGDINGANHFKSAAYIRVAVGVKLNTAITDADIENLVINVERLNTVKTTYGWRSTGHMFNTDNYGQAIEQNASNIQSLQTEVESLKESVNKSPANSGAVWYAVGDSITKGYGVGADNCWVKYVMQYNGYNVDKSKNLGISGLGFAKSDPNYSKTARDVVNENNFSEVSMVTIAIGINDWKEVFSIETVKSEMRYCFEKILTDNPYCKIIFITPFNISIRGSEDTNWALGYEGSDTTGGSLQSFVDTQISVCEEYGIQVIDMTNNSVINKKNITKVLSDGIHPDIECHKAIGSELARRITFA